MTTFRRECIEDYQIVDDDGTPILKLKKGNSYITTAEKDGKVLLFDQWWGAKVPIEVFGASKRFT